jgi:hypothetical protein
MARLRLARVYAMAGDRAKAKGAYQDFLNLVVYLANCYGGADFTGNRSPKVS